MRLELEVEYEPDEEDKEKHKRYVEQGMSASSAWRQVAQDMLGSTGAIVQGAEAFER